MNPAGWHISAVWFGIITSSGIFVMSEVLWYDALRHNIRPGKGEYPLLRCVTSVSCQPRIVFVAGTYIVICGISFALEENAFVIRSVIEPLFINVAACCGISVGNFYTVACFIEVKVDGFEKRALYAVAVGAFGQPLTPISKIKSNAQLTFLSLDCAHHRRQKHGGQQNHLFQNFFFLIRCYDCLRVKKGKYTRRLNNVNQYKVKLLDMG